MSWLFLSPVWIPGTLELYRVSLQGGLPYPRQCLSAHLSLPQAHFPPLVCPWASVHFIQTRSQKSKDSESRSIAKDFWLRHRPGLSCCLVWFLARFCVSGEPAILTFLISLYFLISFLPSPTGSFLHAHCLREISSREGSRNNQKFFLTSVYSEILWGNLEVLQ